MKKVMYVFLVFHVLSIVACCSDDFSLVGAGEMKAYTSQESYESITVVDSTFALHNEMDVEMANNIMQSLFVNELYATTCGEVYLNEINESSLQLVVDKDFDFNGAVVPTGSNLIELVGVSTNFYFSGFFIEFSDEFVQAADFAEEIYTFEVEFDTSDGKTFSNSIELQMDL